MSAQPSAKTPAHVFVTAKEDRRIKRNHQQFQHVVNLMLARMGFPDKAARSVVGILGLLNGRDLSRPAFIPHRWAARQMNFRGKDESADTFMSRALSAIAEAEQASGRKVFFIRRADPTRWQAIQKKKASGAADDVSQICTSYEADYIGEAALWALVEARKSETWAKHPAAAVTDELIDAAIAKLPECPPAPEGEKSDGVSDTDDAVIKSMYSRAWGGFVNAFVKDVDSGKDPHIIARHWKQEIDKLAEEHYNRKCDEIERQRGQDPAAMWEDSGKDIPDTLNAEGVGPATPTPPQTVAPPLLQVAEAQEVAEAENSEAENPTLRAALDWAAEGVAVFPLYGVADGICDCAEGSECGPNTGKHPRTRNGQDDATTDPEQIAAWWRRWPTSNVGGRMGGARRLLAVDVDPRNGGSTSLCDLVETHGDEWLNTRRHRTGGGGFHFFFTVPEGVEIRRGKLGPGVDVKWRGYVVLPPSSHASGGFYSVDAEHAPAEAPAWMLAELSRTASDAPPQVVNFQERRARSSSGGPLISEGERNERLFRIACGIWGGGAASSPSDLCAQLEEINAARVSPPLDAGEVRRIAEGVTSRYARGVPIETEGAA